MSKVAITANGYLVGTYQPYHLSPSWLRVPQAAVVTLNLEASSFGSRTLFLLYLPIYRNVFKLERLSGREQRPSGSSSIWAVLIFPTRSTATTIKRLCTSAYWLCRGSTATTIYRLSRASRPAELPSSTATAPIHRVPTSKSAASATGFPDWTTSPAACHSAKDRTNIFSDSPIIRLDRVTPSPRTQDYSFNYKDTEDPPVVLNRYRSSEV